MKITKTQLMQIIREELAEGRVLSDENIQQSLNDFRETGVKHLLSIGVDAGDIRKIVEDTIIDWQAKHQEN